jgi:phosphatidylserine/phosphatidylglycerophosphate/cardiolipin synthase-like enzyme
MFHAPGLGTACETLEGSHALSPHCSFPRLPTRCPQRVGVRRFNLRREPLERENLNQSSIEVVFSQQAADSTHMKRIAKMIDEAKTSVDVAIYSYSDAEIGRALRDVEARGVKVRFVFDTARKEKLKTGQDLLATKSGRLEQDGVEVRWGNKIMHHKFVIVDGPRDDEAAADTASTATGSAN